MKTIVNIQNRKYVNVRKAVERKIFSPRTARNMLSDDKKHFVEIGGVEFLPVEELSATVKNRIILFEGKDTDQMNAETEDPKSVTEIEFILLFTVTTDRIWRQHITRFSDQSMHTKEEIERLAKTFALSDCILGLNKEGYLLKNIFSAYLNIKKQVQLSNFDCGSYDYFTSKLKDMRINGIEKTIINVKKGLIRLKKMVSPVHEKHMIEFYASPARYKYKEIRDLVNDEVSKLGLPRIGLSSVKTFLGDSNIQNLYKPFRLGWKWAEDRLFPFLIREKPKKTNYQWQTDCTCLNFYVQQPPEKKPSRRWICKVIDVKSRRILAHRIGHYETTELVVSTLKDAILNTHIVPMEINHDRSSAYMSKRMQEVERRLIEIGSFVRISEPGNAKDRGLGEVTWRILQTDYWKKERGYLGDGVRSFVEEGRIDPKLRSEYFKGLHNAIWNEVEFKEMIDKSIQNYNAQTI